MVEEGDKDTVSETRFCEPPASSTEARGVCGEPMRAGGGEHGRILRYNNQKQMTPWRFREHLGRAGPHAPCACSSFEANASRMRLSHINGGEWQESTDRFLWWKKGG